MPERRVDFGRSGSVGVVGLLIIISCRKGECFFAWVDRHAGRSVVGQAKDGGLSLYFSKAREEGFIERCQRTVLTGMLVSIPTPFLIRQLVFTDEPEAEMMSYAIRHRQATASIGERFVGITTSVGRQEEGRTVLPDLALAPCAAGLLFSLHVTASYPDICEASYCFLHFGRATALRQFDHTAVEKKAIHMATIRAIRVLNPLCNVRLFTPPPTERAE